jgi:hypothetical protein
MASNEEATEAELAQLKAERDALAKQVADLEDRPGRRQRMRRVFVAILVIISVLTFSLAVPGTWVRRTLGDTDRYVATVAPLPSDPAVQEYLARTITASVFEALGVQERLSTALQDKAPRLVFLAGPIATSVQGFVQEQVQKLIATQTFADLWISANRLAQQGVKAVLNGDTPDSISVVQGAVVINLLPIISKALAQVSTIATDLLGRPVTIPTIDLQEIPQEAIAKVESATGVDLPDAFGQIKVLDQTVLAPIQDAVSLAQRLLLAAVILTLLAVIGALWLSTRRRRTLIQIMTAWTVVLVIERRAAIAGGNQVVDSAKPENQAAARSVVDAVLGTLLRYTGWMLAITLLVIVIALLTGPYPWAVRTRTWVRDLFAALVSAAKGADRTAAATWVTLHRDALLMAGAAVAVLALLLLGGGWGSFLVILILGGLYALAVWRIAESASADAEPDTGSEPPGA